MLSLAKLHAIFTESTGASLDTRTILPGQLFFALRGDRFDGHDYVDQALSQGAEYCIVDREEFRSKTGCLYCPNVMAILQRLSRFHRDTLDIPLLAITGSNGKTTTKELLHCVIKSKYNTLATRGNLNNHLGVPLTLLELKDSHEFAIIEMGANHIGEIKWLCHLARPTHGFITNIGKAHLEGFGSVANIRKTKSELYHFLDGNGGLIFHNSEEKSLDFVTGLFSNVSSFSHERLLGIPGPLTFKDGPLHQCFRIGDGQEVGTKIYGKFNRSNILAAIAIGSFFKVPSALISKSISDYQPSNNRSQLVKIDGNTFYLDAYNANPSSMLKALEFFKDVDQRSKIIILGDMLELGKETVKEHRKILMTVRTIKDLQAVIVVGPLFTKAAEDIGGSSSICFKDVEEVKRYLGQKKYRNSHILVKGSRGIQLEKLVV